MYLIKRCWDMLLQQLFSMLPDTRCYYLKAMILRHRGFSVSPTARVVSSARFKINNCSVGQDTFIGHEVLFVGGAFIYIGDNVDIAPRCLIVSGTHKIGSSKRRAGEGYCEDIKINNGVWIGAGTTILGGTDIGAGSVVAAGSLLRGKYPPNALLAGVPAEVKKYYSEN